MTPHNGLSYRFNFFISPTLSFLECLTVPGKSTSMALLTVHQKPNTFHLHRVPALCHSSPSKVTKRRCFRGVSRILQLSDVTNHLY